MMYTLMYDGRCVLMFSHDKWERAKTIIGKYIRQFASESDQIGRSELHFVLVEDTEVDDAMQCDIIYRTDNGRTILRNYRQAVA